MADYISREVAIARLTALEIENSRATMAEARRVLADMPAADVIEVVPCKDCAWCSFDSIGNQCCFYGVKLLDSELRPDFYCSHGQKREEGEIEDDP